MNKLSKKRLVDRLMEASVNWREARLHAKPGDRNRQRVTACGAAWFAVSGAGQVVSRPGSMPAGGGIC
jgi:hypothetical protein